MATAGYTQNELEDAPSTPFAAAGCFSLQAGRRSG